MQHFGHGGWCAVPQQQARAQCLSSSHSECEAVVMSGSRAPSAVFLRPAGVDMRMRGVLCSVRCAQTARGAIGVVVVDMQIC